MAESSTSFKKGQSGNPAGKKPGSRNKATRALDAMLDGEGAEILRKAVEMAKEGDMQAIRLCIERLVPPRRDRPITFSLPPIETPADLTKATAALLEAVAAGDLSPGEAAEVAKLLDVHVKAIQTADLDERLRKVEGGL